MIREIRNKTALLYVTKEVYFNAAHRLFNPDKSEEWNRNVFGKCSHPNWHGHNYTLQVTVAGEPDPETGFVIDLSVLKGIIQKKIIDPCDHRNLNRDVPFLKGVIPTTENLVEKFYSELKKEVGMRSAENADLYSVKLYETDRNFAEYRPGRSR